MFPVYSGVYFVKASSVIFTSNEDENSISIKAKRAWPVWSEDLLLVLTDDGYKLIDKHAVSDLSHVFPKDLDPSRVVSSHNTLGYFSGTSYIAYSFTCRFPKPVAYQFDSDIEQIITDDVTFVLAKDLYTLETGQPEKINIEKPIQYVCYHNDSYYVLHSDGTVYDSKHDKYLELPVVEKICSIKDRGIGIISDNKAYIYNNGLLELDDASDIIVGESAFALINENKLIICSEHLDQICIKRFKTHIQKAVIHFDTIYVSLTSGSTFRCENNGTKYEAYRMTLKD